MCPVRWSDEEGTGTEVAFGEGELNAGVANGCVSAGDEDEEGVEACSVANRSGVGEGRRGRLHAKIKRRTKIVKRNLRLLIIQLDGLQIKFLPR